MDAEDMWIEIKGVWRKVCAVCKEPTESEPCPIDQPDAYGAIE